MVSIGEVVGALDADIARVGELESKTASAKAVAEELRDRLAEMDIHGSVAQLEVTIEKLDAASVVNAAVRDKLTKAREQVQAAEYGLRGQGGSGGGAASASSTSASPGVVVDNDLPKAPFKETWTREDPAKAAKPSRKPLSGKEILEQAKSKGSKFGRFTQAYAENAEDIGNLAKDTTDTGLSIMRNRDPNPPVEEMHTSTQHAGPVIEPYPVQTATVGDFLATGVMMGAVTTMAIRNMRQRREETR